MRQIFYIFIAYCLIYSQCFAVSLIGSGIVAGSASTPCASCVTCGGCATADLLCEDWDADNGCSWTEDYDGDAVDDIDQAASHSGSLSCTDKGSYALNIESDNAGDTYIFTDIGAQQAVTYTQFYLNVVSEELEDSDEQEFAYFGQGGISSNAMFLTLSQSSGQLRIDYRYRSNSTWSAVYSQNISTGTWYRIRLYHNTSGEVAFYVDGTTVHSDNSATVDRAWDVIAFGNSNGSAGDSYTIQVDNIEIDDDTMPGACD